MLKTEDLLTLADLDAAPVVSIYIPTHQSGREIRGDPIRLKNALAAVEAKLSASGLRTTEVADMLQGAVALLDNPLFWRHQSQTLALFAARGFFRSFRLPIQIPEAHFVAARAWIKPLLRLFAADGRFYCLSASAGDARLYEGSRFALDELDVDLPRSVAEVSAETDYENMRHASPPARPRTAGHIGMPASHNFGEDPEEQRKSQLIQHLRRLVDAISNALVDTTTPVVLIAAPEVEGHLRALAGNRVPFLENGVQIDPGALDQRDLHARAYEIVQPLFTRKATDAVDRFCALHGAGESRGSDRLAEIVAAATIGRIDTLLLAEGEAVWGTVNPDDGSCRVATEPSAGDRDLLDYAAVETLRARGSAHLLPRNALPVDRPALAILRY